MDALNKLNEDDKKFLIMSYDINGLKMAYEFEKNLVNDINDRNLKAREKMRLKLLKRQIEGIEKMQQHYRNE